MREPDYILGKKAMLDHMRDGLTGVWIDEADLIPPQFIERFAAEREPHAFNADQIEGQV